MRKTSSLIRAFALFTVTVGLVGCGSGGEMGVSEESRSSTSAKSQSEVAGDKELQIQKEERHQVERPAAQIIAQAVAGTRLAQAPEASSCAGVLSGKAGQQARQALPSNDSGGPVFCMVATARDITGRVMAWPSDLFRVSPNGVQASDRAASWTRFRAAQAIAWADWARTVAEALRRNNAYDSEAAARQAIRQLAKRQADDFVARLEDELTRLAGRDPKYIFQGASAWRLAGFHIELDSAGWSVRRGGNPWLGDDVLAGRRYTVAWSESYGAGMDRKHATGTSTEREERQEGRSVAGVGTK